MSNSIFTIPSDFNVNNLIRLVKENEKLNIKAKEVYGSLKTSAYGSGRKFFELPDTTHDNFVQYLAECKKNNIRFNYTLNSSCYGNDEFSKEERDRLLSWIQELVDDGVRQFTVALPSVIHLLNEAFPEVKVTLSIIIGVDSISKMNCFCQYPNINSIYLHERIYRQHKLVKKLTDIAHEHGKKVGMIVNSFCLSDCPYRMAHYNYGAHATMGNEYIIPEYYGSKCALSKISDLRNVLNAPWVRPNDLETYMDLGVDRFKISGREMYNNNANMLKVLETYNQRKYDGNLVDLFMCFTDCTYSELFEIKNNQYLDQYLENVYRGENLCNVNGCTDCGLCKNALSAIKIKKEGRDKWTLVFEERLKNFGKV